MARPPKSIPTTSPANTQSAAAFVTLGEGGSHQTGLRSYDGFHSAIGRDTYKDYDRNTSVRNQFTRNDYEFFRPNEAIPHKAQEIISMCRNAYHRVGLIHNVIDLMSDFGCQGARLIHPNPTMQKFYRGWWKKVDGARISERFLNLFYREGVAVTKRTMARLPMANEKQMRAMGDKLQPDVDADKLVSTSKRNIPFRYNFLNPLTLEVLGEELSQFVGRQEFALKVSYRLRQSVQSPKNDAEKRLVALLPQEIRAAIQRGDTVIPLDADKVRAFFYKKDDWQTWAHPFTYAIMDDIFLLEKMKLADLAALDGAISQIRLWKLGYMNDAHPDMSIFPTEGAINRLSEILMSNPGGGAFDIIWGPELSVEEYKTNVHQFLGEEKYRPVWNSIYAGLGVPPTLTGAATSSGFTNNYISLKTLIQRLEYGRAALRAFWEQELELVRQAMGFSQAAKLVFDNMVLSDEAAEKALLIQLIDRDVISVETLTERFGGEPEFEQLRLKKEEEARKKGKMKPKASPWHTPEKMHEFMKLALQRGYISPEQTGMKDEFPEEFLDVETPFDKQMKGKDGPLTQEHKSGIPSPGRPKNAKDKEPRDQRTPKPTGAAAYMTAMMWARHAQQQIAEIVSPLILKHYGKTSMRALSEDQVRRAEGIKFAILCSLPVYSNVDADVVRQSLSAGKAAPKQYQHLYDALYKKVVARKQGEPSIDETRMMQITAYAVLNSDEEQIPSDS